MRKTAIIRKFCISSAVILLSSAGAMAACYEEVEGPPVVQCSGSFSNSADFAERCDEVPGPPVRVEVECPGRWVNYRPSTATNYYLGGPVGDDSHAAACATAGLKPGNIDGQICASGERRPTKGQGAGSINYAYGTSGIANYGGTMLYRHTTRTLENRGGSSSGGTTWSYATNEYCRMGGQADNHELTDRVVAYYCQP